MMPGRYHSPHSNVLDASREWSHAETTKVPMLLTPRFQGILSRRAVGTVAVAAALNPLNTTLVPGVLPAVQREFGVSASAATLLLVSFSLTCAVAHPLAGYIADRWDPRDVLVAGLVLVGASSIAAACAPAFLLLVLLRGFQALGTSVGFPAGLALLRDRHDPDGSNDPIPHRWLGLVAMVSNGAAAAAPVLGAALAAAIGWRAVFIASGPVALISAAVVRLQFAPGRRPRVSAGYGRQDLRALIHSGLASVCVRFAAVCSVFFSGLFFLPIWLVRYELKGVAAGAVMAATISCAMVISPLTVRLLACVGSRKTLMLGACSLCCGALWQMAAAEWTSILLPVLAGAALGTGYGICNLALQAELTRRVARRQMGVASGIFQTSRFLGATLAAAILALVAVHGSLPVAASRLGLAMGSLSVALLLWTLTARAPWSPAFDQASK
jgi:MFS family permease